MYRIVAFATPLAGALYLWNQLGRPFAAAGAMLLTLLAVTTWPVVVIAAVAVVPYSLSLCWPRRARAWWRAGAARHAQSSGRAPKQIQNVVWAADRNKCVNCHQPGAHVDHRVPWSWGGMSLLPNLFLLCAACNLVKMTFWVDRRGVEHGRTPDRTVAREIWAAERRARWSLLRWFRIAWVFA